MDPYVDHVSAVWFRVSIVVRRRAASIVVAAVVIGVLAGLALALTAGTRRTASAPDRYTAWAGGDPDLQITQQAGLPLTDRVASLPGVSEAKGYTFVLSFPLSPKDGAPLLDLNPFAGQDDVVGARVVEGRFTDPDEPYEFTVNRPLARELERRFGTKVGDRFEFVSYSSDQVRGNVDLEKEAPALDPFTATLVGITESPTEFDEAGAQLVLSDALLDAHPDVGVVQSLIVAKVGSGTDPRSVLDAVRSMPAGVDAYGVPIRIVSDSARRAVSYQAFALWLVSALALAASAVIAAQIVARTLRVGDDERSVVTTLGWRSRDLAAERAIAGAVIGVIALPVAVAVAYAGSIPFPLGLLASLEPHPGATFDLLVLCVGLPAIVVVAGAAGAYAGARGSLARSRSAPSRAGATQLPADVGMPLTVGMNFATSTVSGRRPWRGIVLGAIGLAGLVGSAFTGVALVDAVDTSARWGVDFDAMFGNPYIEAPGDLVTPLLDLDGVVDVTAANIGSVTIEGSDTSVLAFEPSKGDLEPVVLSGRAPVGDDEIALGAEVARKVGVGVGDDVEVQGVTGESFPMEVVGIVVTPDMAGGGAAMTFGSYERTNPDATRNVVFVRFAPDAPAEVEEEVAAAIYSPPDSLATPVSIRALERVTAAPFILAGVFALVLAVSGTYLLVASVSGRSRELAVLRALGAERRQLRAVVRWQTALVVGAMVLIGVPVGILLARVVLRAVTTALGIVPTVDFPVLLVVACALVPLALADVVAILSAWRSRAGVGELSRDG